MDPFVTNLVWLQHICYSPRPPLFQSVNPTRASYPDHLQIDKIKITMEVEEDERLSFLDGEVIRSNGALKKKLFRKESYAGIILNLRSHHNYRLKIGIMRSIIIWSLRLTDVELWDEELDKLTMIFLDNYYPNEVIQRNIRAVKSR
ncbi:unnamed protein product [Protopolystoma xenopodis]|uniref:Helix-turn-helix domain-containing protein n=1 Tax=Protopolystoma xenopodis TaxID=117903 RepID=A0A448XIP2_9PLAT|nr:unnamed protein product [Protopolystoma xenopodis]